jgi:hypothetical protein
MDPEARAALRAVYEAVLYELVEPALTLRVGEPCAALDALLTRRGARQFAWLTAWNPGGAPAPEAENLAAQEELEAALVALGAAPLSGVARGLDGWPDEPSLLAPGLAFASARGLAARFGQIAFLHGHRGAAPALCFVTEPA